MSVPVCFARARIRSNMGRDPHEEGHRATLVRVEGHLGVELGQQHLGGGLAYSSAQEEGQAKSVEVGQYRVEHFLPVLNVRASPSQPHGSVRTQVHVG